MKKFLVPILALFLSFGFINSNAQAQTKPAAKKEAAPTKKDGTPDMRYKENKKDAAATPAPKHMKKDGTPDKRFKENK